MMPLLPLLLLLLLTASTRCQAQKFVALNPSICPTDGNLQEKNIRHEDECRSLCEQQPNCTAVHYSSQRCHLFIGQWPDQGIWDHCCQGRTSMRAAAPMDFVQIGCYADSEDRDLAKLKAPFNASMTWQLCLSKCRTVGTRYMGLQAGGWCVCGDSYGKFGEVNGSECRLPCKGDPGLPCGNQWRNLVFQIRF